MTEDQHGSKVPVRTAAKPRQNLAVLRSYAAFVTAARGPGIQVAGRYEDRLIREEGSDKFNGQTMMY
jgi:hypothetical protein